MAEEVCPDKKDALDAVRLYTATMTRQIKDWRNNMYDQLIENASKFMFFALAVDES